MEIRKPNLGSVGSSPLRRTENHQAMTKSDQLFAQLKAAKDASLDVKQSLFKDLLTELGKPKNSLEGRNATAKRILPQVKMAMKESGLDFSAVKSIVEEAKLGNNFSYELEYKTSTVGRAALFVGTAIDGIGNFFDGIGKGYRSVSNGRTRGNDIARDALQELNRNIANATPEEAIRETYLGAGLLTGAALSTAATLIGGRIPTVLTSVTKSYIADIEKSQKKGGYHKNELMTKLVDYLCTKITTAGAAKSGDSEADVATRLAATLKNAINAYGDNETAKARIGQLFILKLPDMDSTYHPLVGQVLSQLEIGAVPFGQSISIKASFDSGTANFERFVTTSEGLVSCDSDINYEQTNTECGKHELRNGVGNV